MRNKEGIDERKIVTKLNFKRYEVVFAFVVQFVKTRVIDV